MSADAAMEALETACAAAGIDLDKKYDRKTRRENYRTAIDRYELCRLALPVIFALKIINDSKLKYARCAIMLASEQTRYTGVQALCADAVRATCGVKRASSIPNNAKIGHRLPRCTAEARANGSTVADLDHNAVVLSERRKRGVRRDRSVRSEFV